MTDETCCWPFDPEPWDDKTHKWKDKRFVKDKVLTFYFMPINFAAVMRRLMKKVETVGAGTSSQLALSDHVSPWRMDIYLEVEKDVPGTENVTLSGEYFSRVYEGPFRDSKLWCKDFEATVADKGLTASKWYMWYTTCPKCAKKYGKNYVVILGRID